MTVGRIYDPKFANEIVASGSADFVVMTRALIADPAMPNKARGTNEAPLRHCVGAMECWKRTRKNFAVSCAVNPEAGRETLFPQQRTSTAKRVVVVGAGPAGIEAAVRLYDAGHSVVVLERGRQTGGRLNIAALAGGQDYRRFMEDHRKELARRPGIALEFGVEATAATIHELAPEGLVVATGGTPARPSVALLPGALSLDQALLRQDLVGQTVAIYAETRGLAPLATAITLAASGRAVRICTPHGQIGADLDPNTYNTARRRLAEAHVEIVTDVILSDASDGSARVADLWPSWPQSLDQPATDLDCDSFVYDVGDAPDDALFSELDGGPVPIVRIGDCLTPRGLIGAMWDAAGVVPVLEERLTRATR
jgi:NADPH-dependent 2,4-dienoyl-CoA reductase/sulfur reductase-like enzyme